jgi:hypothetical protein
MGTDRESEEDIEMNEKSFEIGQKVRIIGPTYNGHAVYIGKCFWIDAKKLEGYSRKDCGAVFPASSLELADPESDRLDAIEQRLDSIEKRLQPLEGKANNEVATDTSDEPPELHVGNYVEVVGQPLVIFGHPTGMTDRVWRLLYPAGLIALESSGLWYSRRSLRKLSDDEIIAKIGRERKA